MKDFSDICNSPALALKQPEIRCGSLVQDGNRSKLAMEADLLLYGTAEGIKNGWDQVIDHPIRTGISTGLLIGASAVLFGALELRGYRFRTAANLALELGLVYDLGSRAFGTLSAMNEAWHEPAKAGVAQRAIASNLGEGIFDYALNGAISAGVLHLTHCQLNPGRSLCRQPKRAKVTSNSGNDPVPVRLTASGNDVFEKQTLSSESPLQRLWLKGKNSVVHIEGVTPETASGGTGFFVSSDGLIATNNHVVSGMKHSSIVTDNGQRFSVKLVARDKINDLALVRVTDAPPGTVFAAASLNTADGATLANSSLAPIAKIPTLEPLASPVGSQIGLLAELPAGAPIAIIGYPVKFGEKMIAPGEVVGKSGWKRLSEKSPFVDQQPLAEFYMIENRKAGGIYIDHSFEKPGMPYIRREVVVHNAATSAGNSGSPVFNMDGDVVSVHSNCRGSSIHVKHLEAMIKQTKLTPPGDGWLNIRSHAEPVGSAASNTAEILSVQMCNRWSLGKALRESLDSKISAKEMAERWRFLSTHAISAVGVASVASRIESEFRSEIKE